jgi:hypothetical protein
MLRVIPKIYRPHMIQAAEHVFEAVHTQRTCVAYSFRSYLWRSNARVAVKVLRRRIHPSDWRVPTRLLGRPLDALVCTKGRNLLLERMKTCIGFLLCSSRSYPRRHCHMAAASSCGLRGSWAALLLWWFSWFGVSFLDPRRKSLDEPSSHPPHTRDLT